MKKIVKFVAIGIIAAAIAVFAAVSAMAPLRVKTVALAPREAHAYFIEDGTIAEGDDIQVFPGVSGSVLRVLAEAGQPVRAGDILAEIDPADYAAERDLIQAGIRTIRADIESVRSGEERRKEDCESSIKDLEAQLATIGAQRSSARSERIQTVSAADQVKLLELSQAQAQRDAAFWDEQRKNAQQLFDGGALSKSELDEVKKQHESAASQLAQYGEQLAAKRAEQAGTNRKNAEVSRSADAYYDSLAAAASLQIETLRASLKKDYSAATIKYYDTLIEAENEKLKSVEKNIEKCSIKSPADGYVRSLPISGVSQLAPQACAAVIKKADSIKCESFVSTRDIGSVRIGDEVSVTLKGRDTDVSFAGTVEEILEWAEARPSALGIEEKRVKAVIGISDGAPGRASGSAAGTAPPQKAGDALKPGYGVDVQFTVYRGGGKLMVPSSALFEMDGRDYVIVMENQKAVYREVSTGPKAGTETVIESGLSPGEQVVAESNTEGLREGSSIASLD